MSISGLLRPIAFCASLALASTVALAQVGINTDNPEQTLDVNGKVRIGNDDIAPSPGTIRFNEQGEDFEGFDGNSYRSLTATGGPSETARPAALYHFGLANSGIWSSFSQGTSWPIATVPVASDPLSDTQYFVVEKVTVTPTTAETAASDSYYTGIAQALLTGSRFNPQLFYRTNAGNGTLNVTANKAPLLVVNPGRTLEVWNSTTSPGPVRIVVFGVFVDDVSDYWGL